MLRIFHGRHLGGATRFIARLALARRAPLFGVGLFVRGFLIRHGDEAASLRLELFCVRHIHFVKMWQLRKRIDSDPLPNHSAAHCGRQFRAVHRRLPLPPAKGLHEGSECAIRAPLLGDIVD